MEVETFINVRRISVCAVRHWTPPDSRSCKVLSTVYTQTCKVEATDVLNDN